MGNKSRRNWNPSLLRKRKTYPFKQRIFLQLFAILFIIYCISAMLFFYLYGVRSSPEDSFRDAQTLNQKVSFQQNAEHNIIKPSKVPKSNRTETEDFYLTMYRTIQKSQDICNQKITHTSSLLKDLHEYIHKSHPQIQNQCSSPPKISCAKSFSVVIVFYQTDEMGSMADHFDVNTNEDNPHLTLSSQRLRTLFLNILTLINIPNHSPDITVIYHGNIHDLREDRPYGDRIWNWSLKGHHRRIRLVYSTDHVTSSKDEDDIIDTEDITDTELLKDIYFPLHSSIVSKAKSDILLFLDGSKALTHGDTGGIDSIQAGFDLIRLHSHALVGNEDGIRRFENRNENWTDVKIGKESFRPICGEPQILVHHSRQVKKETIPRSGAVLSFHGLFFHRSYSCYIWDKPLDNFRDNMNSISMNHVHSSRNLGLLASSLSMFVPLSRANSELVFVYPTLSQTYNNLLYTAPHRILQDMDMKDDRGKYDLHNVPTASRKRKKRLDSESTIPQIQTSTRDLQSILTSESVRRNLSIERKTRLTVHHNLEPNLQQNTIQNYQTHSFAVSEEMELKKVLQYFGGYFPVDFLLSETMKSKEDPLTWRHEQKSMCS
jgi:hypothetical protein